MKLRATHRCRTPAERCPPRGLARGIAHVRCPCPRAINAESRQACEAPQGGQIPYEARVVLRRAEPPACRAGSASSGAARSRALLCSLGLALGACAAPRPASPPPAPSVPARTLATTVVTPDEALSVDELFARGLARAAQGDHAGAARDFDAVAQHAPLTPRAERALFHSALAHEASGDLDTAAARFEESARRFPASARGDEVLARAIRLRLHRDHFAAAADSGALLLERHPASGPLERILAHGARALAALELGDLPSAERSLARGLDVVRALELDRAGKLARDVAQLYFALGEARRHKAEAATLSADPADFAARLERRCELLLSAQSAYADAMRAYDAHWSARAGYRIAELYQRLHTELMQIPPPATADADQRRLFEGAMRLRYSILVEKALTMLEHTLAMAARSGENSEWVRRSALTRRDLEQLLELEQAALSQLPYPRSMLEDALEDLERRGRL